MINYREYKRATIYIHKLLRFILNPQPIVIGDFLLVNPDIERLYTSALYHLAQGRVLFPGIPASYVEGSSLVGRGLIGCRLKNNRLAIEPLTEL